MLEQQQFLTEAQVQPQAGTQVGGLSTPAAHQPAPGGRAERTGDAAGQLVDLPAGLGSDLPAPPALAAVGGPSGQAALVRTTTASQLGGLGQESSRRR